MQPTVSKSSIEADYLTLGYIVAKTIWIHKLLYDLGIVIPDHVCLYCDNISVIYMLANSIHHNPSKHIIVDYHFVHEQVATGDLVVQYIPTSLQIADNFTKGLSSKQLLFLKSNLTMHPADQIEGRNSVGILLYFYKLYNPINISSGSQVEMNCSNHSQ